MGCQLIVQCPRLPVEEIVSTAECHGFNGRPAADAVERLVDFTRTPMHLCGEMEHVEHCKCGHEAGFVCDQPMGRGKTCDIPLCHCCRRAIGEDFDLCPMHAAMWRPAASVRLDNNPRIVRPLAASAVPETEEASAAARQTPEGQP